MSLHTLQLEQGATFAPDGIPLHFGNQTLEYEAALNAAVVLERTHEARFALLGTNQYELIQRMSTNDVLNIPVGAGRATIFTNPNARVIDRVEIYNLGDQALMLGDPGRGGALMQYIQRNIFYGDDVRLKDLGPDQQQFDLHGPQAQNVIQQVAEAAAGLAELQAIETTINDLPVTIVRRKPVSQQRWTIIVVRSHSAEVWKALTDHGAVPGGSLIYNVLRIRAGLPTIGRELSADYIPLEIGLWDEVNFQKGCYTGQEIIARMESRQRMAKTIVTLKLTEFVPAPALIYSDGKTAGKLTSSVVAPDGTVFAIGVVKMAAAQPGHPLTVGEGQVSAQVDAPAGIQPQHLLPEQEA